PSDADHHYTAHDQRRTVEQGQQAMRARREAPQHTNHCAHPGHRIATVGGITQHQVQQEGEQERDHAAIEHVAMSFLSLVPKLLPTPYAHSVRSANRPASLGRHTSEAFHCRYWPPQLHRSRYLSPHSL